ncbi:MAG: hypothetical protein GKR95_17505 [Gammaproteobacteria bacterium]|nr:hypothetical protein [Gammaproteobacteria bacterium]
MIEGLRTSPVSMDQEAYESWKDYRTRRYLTDPNQLRVMVRNPFQLTQHERASLLDKISRNNFVVYEYDLCQDDIHAAFEECQIEPEKTKSQIIDQHVIGQHGLSQKNDRLCPVSNRGYAHICRQLGLVDSIPNPESGPNDVTLVREINQTRGLHELDFPSDSPTENVDFKRYIPYTNKPLGWHTDGYYNSDKHIVRSFILHCERPAIFGGANELVDPEMIYFQLRDANPQWAEALTQPDVMAIPANRVDNRTLRREFRGPVFHTDPNTGYLYTRYTQRKRNIRWKTDTLTEAALEAMHQLLEEDNQWKIRIRLTSGQGIICNNVIHRRTAFSDNNANSDNRNPGAETATSSKRCLHRIRFGNRLPSTGVYPPLD